MGSEGTGWGPVTRSRGAQQREFELYFKRVEKLLQGVTHGSNISVL